MANTLLTWRLVQEIVVPFGMLLIRCYRLHRSWREAQLVMRGGRQLRGMARLGRERGGGGIAGALVGYVVVLVRGVA